MKSRIISIVLLLVMVAPFGATYIWLQYQKIKVKRSIKWQMIDGMEKSDLVFLSFSKEDAKTKLRWEHTKEFEYKQEMYDVVDRQEKGDSVLFWCWWDNDETQLNRKLAGLVSHVLDDDPSKKESEKRLQTFYKSVYFSNTPILAFNVFEPTLILIKSYRFSIQTLVQTPPTPPPQFG